MCDVCNKASTATPMLDTVDMTSLLLSCVL